MKEISKEERADLATLNIDSIEAGLEVLERFGEPRLSRFDNGWYSCIEVRVNSVGVKFEVKSNYDHETPLEAVLVCISRLNKALKSLGVTL